MTFAQNRLGKVLLFEHVMVSLHQILDVRSKQSPTTRALQLFRFLFHDYRQ